jgi:hypothetical protein
VLSRLPGDPRREPGLAWAAAALGILEALAPALAAAQEPVAPGASAPQGLAEEALLHVPRAGRLEGGVRALAFSSDGRWLATGGVDGSVYAFDVGGATRTAEEAAAPLGPLFRHGGAVAGVAVIGRGASVLVASAGDDGVVAWSRCPPPAGGPERAGAAEAGAAAPGAGAEGAGAAGAGAGAGTAGAGAGSGTEGAAGGAVVSAALPAVITASAGIGPITALAVLEARGASAASGGTEALLAAHAVVVGGASGALAALEPARLPSPLWTRPAAHRGAVVALAAPGPGRVASAGADGAVRLFDAAQGTPGRSAAVSKLELTSLAASADGALLAVGGWERGVRILDAQTLRPAREPLEPHRGVTGALLLLGGRASGGASGGSTRGGAKGAARLLVTASIADESIAVLEVPPKGANGNGGGNGRAGAGPEGSAAAASLARAKPLGVAAALAAPPEGGRIAAGTFQGDVYLYRIGAEADRAR